MIFRGIAALCLSAWIAAPSEAAQFYYVGGVYDYANVDGEPLFAVGEMTVDESKLPAGQGLAGLEINASLDYAAQRMGPDYFSLRLTQNTGSPIYDTDGPQSGFDIDAGGGSFVFDEDGMPSYWNFEENTLSGTIFNGNRGDGSIGFTFEHEADIDADIFLTDLGYKRGTKRFEDLKSSHSWRSGFASQSGGEWYTDPLQFAAAVAKRTMDALSRGVSNIYDIPHCRVADAASIAEDFAPPLPA